MRVISGKYGGQRLVSFKADHIRPTTDQTKESIFNRLVQAFGESRVLDLYSGTGSLGIEALSRGARLVTMVEKNAKSVKIIKENLAKLKITEGIELKAVDVFSFLKGYEGEPYDILLVDPPFTEALAHATLESIAKSKVWKPQTQIVIESGQKEKLLDLYSPFRCVNRKDFGDKKVSFFTCE